MKVLLLAASAGLLMAGAVASVQSADAATSHQPADVRAAAMSKCVADTSALGSPNPREQCTCFVEALSDDELAAYLDVRDWDRDASPAMKRAGARCFPELQ